MLGMPKYLRDKRVPHKVTRIQLEKVIKKDHKSNPSERLARDIARELCGFSPYEKKAIDMISSGNVKPARKFLKRRLGSLKRAEKRFDSLFEQIKR